MNLFIRSIGDCTLSTTKLGYYISKKTIMHCVIYCYCLRNKIFLFVYEISISILKKGKIPNN